MKGEIDFYIDTECENEDSFDCGFAVFNEYLKRRVPKDKAAFHYIVDSGDGSLIAYFSLLASCVFAVDPAESNIIPAIELKMFAIDKKYQKQKLSNRLVDAISYLVSEYSSEYVGAELLILYSVPAEKVVKMYERSGFKVMPENFSMYKSYFTESCVPMYQPIR